MVNMIGLFMTVIAIYIPLIKGDKEWIFQFDLKNKNNWENYEITPNNNIEANGCSPRIPKLFQKLCVEYNKNDGYKLKLKSALNMNLDPHYHDLLWYYGDHQTAKNAEQVAKAKYIDYEEQELTEITPSNTMLRRRLITSKAKLRDAKKCYYYDDIQACAHMDASNKDLLTVSVGLKDEIAAANEEAEDYYDDAYDDDEEYDDDSDYDSDYYDDSDIDYEDYDLSDIYNEYMQEYNQLLNQQWANYLANWNNMYWNNYYPQMAQAQAAAQAQYYGDYEDYGDYYDSDDYSGDSEDNNGGMNGLGIQEGQIMQKAEAEARKHVEAKMEKQLEAKLENQMMSQMNSGGMSGGMFGGNSHGYVHKKHHYGEEEGGEMGEHEDDGGDMDAEHSGMPIDDGDGEDDQVRGPPHDSLSAEAEN